MKQIKIFLYDESGQDMVEYGLITGFLALAGIASLHSLAANIATFFTGVNSNLTNAV